MGTGVYAEAMSRPNLSQIKSRKGGEPMVMLTAYDYPSARLAVAAGVDLLLVGDSLGTTVLGYQSTIPVRLEAMLQSTQAVRRAAPETFVVVDLPFLSYATLERALASAGVLIQEGGADAVKLEGGSEVVPVVQGLIRAGVPVMGHVGLTPQTAGFLGGNKVQGKDLESAQRILEGALALEEAGAFGIVLELVPAALAELITARVKIPTIGIGSGPATDGQVLVFHDLLGLNPEFQPKFLKRYLEGFSLAQAAIAQYAGEVRARAFPGPEHSFSLNPDVLKRLQES